jgi:chromosome segregation ATPase
VGYLGPIEPQPESQPESDTEPQQVNDWPSVRDLRRELKAVQDKNAKLQTQADELRSEIHYLQRELAVSKEQLTIAAAVSQQLQIELDAAQQVPADSPELRRVVELETLVEKHVDTIGRMQQEIQQQQRELQKRALRIFDLDTISTAQEKAVVDAGKQNDELRAAIDAADKQLDQKDAQIRDLRIELDAAQQVPQANDKLAQLEALQPMAAACSTVQTMVRDMLGHMRCLVSLNSTTDRSNFCTLLESILEVFDDVECDDDETSEAEQG